MVVTQEDDAQVVRNHTSYSLLRVGYADEMKHDLGTKRARN